MLQYRIDVLQEQGDIKMNDSEKIIFSQGESSDLIGKIITKGVLSSIIIFILAIIRTIQIGLNNNLMVLLIGSFYQHFLYFLTHLSWTLKRNINS